MVHHCFTPQVRPDTRLLILGSLPGAASLAAARYYAHPQNQFWRLVGGVMEEDIVSLPYEARIERLLERGIGLWDTVAAAQRDGSLDAAIRLESASDLVGLAGQLPALEAMAFNGGTAARIGRRQLGPLPGFDLVDLPSSSAAYTLAFGAKLATWRRLEAYLLPRPRTSAG